MRSGPKQAEGEPPGKERVNATRHYRFPGLEGVPRIRFHHTAVGEHERPEWSVRRRVLAAFFPCHSVKVLVDQLGGSFSCRVLPG